MQQVHVCTFVPATQADLTDCMWRSVRWAAARACGTAPTMHLQRCAGCHEVRVTLEWPHTRRTLSFRSAEATPVAPVRNAFSAA